MKIDVHPDHIKEASRESAPRPASKYRRMCPQCGCIEGPGDTIILEDNSGAVWCKNCNALLAYFEVWDLDAQVKIAKSWCCKHPQQFRMGIGILDNRVIHMGRHCKHRLKNTHSGHHPRWCQCTFSEAAWDTTPEGFQPVNKYICFKCLTVVTRKTEDMDRNDVSWSKPFLDSLSRIGGRDMEGMKMGNWLQAPDEPLRIKDKPGTPINVDKVDKYPLTLDEYCALPYLVNMHRDMQQFGALVIELNLVVHADNPDALLDKVKEETRAWIQTRMDNHEHIPLPAGYEVNDGKVRRTPGTMGAAIPMQYQKYGRV